jgi:hypothetical protein
MERGYGKGARRAHGDRGGRRTSGHSERSREEKRQRSGAAPTEDAKRRAIEAEPGVEWHAGEDAGEVPDSEE